MFRSLTILSLAALAAPAQTVSRFYSYTVEETSLDASQIELRILNNRGSLLAVNVPTGQMLLRLATGALATFSATAFVRSLNNRDQLLLQASGGATIWDAGVYTLCDYYGGRDSSLRSVGMDLADDGRFLSGQATYWSGGIQYWVSPRYIIGSASGSSLLTFSGLPGGLSQHVTSGFGDPEFAVADGPINARGEFLVYARWATGSPPHFEEGLFRATGGGVLTQVFLPPVLAPDGINDEGEVYGTRNGDGAPFLQRLGGGIDLPALAVEGAPMNRWGERVAMLRNPRTKMQVALRSGAHAALETLIADGMQYSWFGAGRAGDARINDLRQVVVGAANLANQTRLVLLHPSTTPVLSLEFRSGTRNATNRRFDAVRESDGRTPVRIVGGEPGQPTAMFLKLGTQYHYIDGTLGFFDSVQTFEFRLTVPASLVGLDFDVSAGALDNQFGILRSLDQPITFR